MLVATFGPTTEWVGKTVTKDGDLFRIEDVGSVSAADVIAYDRQGHLSWVDEGTHAWVRSLALKPPPAPPASAPPQQSKQAALPPLIQSKDARTGGQRAAGLAGLLLLVLGVGIAGYFLLFFDVSVPVDYQGLDNFGLPDRVNNIGLMADRNNGIIVGLVLAVAGGVLMVIGRRRTASALEPVAAAPLGQTGIAAEVERLSALHAAGSLSDEEFAAMKAKVIGSS